METKNTTVIQTIKVIINALLDAVLVIEQNKNSEKESSEL